MTTRNNNSIFTWKRHNLEGLLQGKLPEKVRHTLEDRKCEVNQAYEKIDEIQTRFNETLNDLEEALGEYNDAMTSYKDAVDEVAANIQEQAETIEDEERRGFLMDWADLLAGQASDSEAELPRNYNEIDLDLAGIDEDEFDNNIQDREMPAPSAPPISLADEAKLLMINTFRRFSGLPRLTKLPQD